VFGITKSKGTPGNKIVRTKAPVSQLQIFPSDGTIRLTWQPPNKATQIIVIRKKGAMPKDINDGDRLKTGNTMNGCVDNDLNNNQKYEYLVVPFFEGIRGENLQGVPTAICGTPRELPPAPGEVSWNVSEQGLDIQWNVVPNCDCKFYISSSPLGKKGVSVEPDDPVFANADVIAACDYSKGRGRYPKLLTKPVYLTPVSRNKYVVLLGDAVLVVPVRNVENFRSERNAGNIYLTWDWGTAEEVLLVYRTDSLPDSLNDKRATQVKVTRAMYQSDLAYAIKRVDDEDSYYFLVSAGASHAGKQLFSAPLQHINPGSGEQTVLKYELIKKRNFLPH
jgi:hypothetical protein